MSIFPLGGFTVTIQNINDGITQQYKQTFFIQLEVLALA